MTSNLFNGNNEALNLFLGNNDNPMGTVTSGGTESISLAMLACRNYGRMKYGITKPEMFRN